MFFNEKREILEELPSSRTWAVQSPRGLERVSGGFDGLIDVW
jgi:hypothetical protein